MVGLSLGFEPVWADEAYGRRRRQVPGARANSESVFCFPKLAEACTAQLSVGKPPAEVPLGLGCSPFPWPPLAF